MEITRRDQNTVYLGGERVQINDLACSEALTPGMLIERDNAGGTIRWKKHATAGGDTARIVATEQSMQNLGVDDNYAINDLVEASALQPGSFAWMLIGSDAVEAGDGLESAGNGLLRKLSSGTKLFTALENYTGSTTSRIRAEVV